MKKVGKAASKVGAASKKAMKKAGNDDGRPMNRTGVLTAPDRADRAMTEARNHPPDPAGDGTGLIELQMEYTRDAATVGAVPVSDALDLSAASNGRRKAARNPEVLVDKLAERLVFERSGVRLYDALIAKCTARPALSKKDIKRLEHFRDEELEHFHLLTEAMTRIGADATAMTPSADIVGVTSSGVMKVITDPRSRVADAIQAILVAELADNDGWDALIQIADGMGLSDMADEFRDAMAREEEHLEGVREIHSSLLMKEAGAA